MCLVLLIPEQNASARELSRFIFFRMLFRTPADKQGSGIRALMKITCAAVRRPGTQDL